LRNPHPALSSCPRGLACIPWGDRPTARRNPGDSRLRNRPHRIRRAAACGVPAASLPAQRSGVQDAFCPARSVEMMGDRGRDASLRDTNAARADARAPRVSSGSPRRNCARHTTDAPLPSPPRSRARSRDAVVVWSVTTFERCLFITHLGLISPIKETLAWIPEYCDISRHENRDSATYSDQVLSGGKH